MKAQHSEPGHTHLGKQIAEDAANWLANLPPIMQALAHDHTEELNMLGDVLQAYFVIGYQRGFEDGRDSKC